MQDVKPISTPLFTSCDLTPTSDAPSCHIREFRHIIVSLQYLYLTCLDVSFPMNKLSKYMQTPTKIHMKLPNVYSAISRGHLTMVFTSLAPQISLITFCDSDWAGDTHDCKSIAVILFIWSPISSIGPLRSNPLLLKLPRRLKSNCSDHYH